MNKSDLRTGMWVKFKNGETAMVLLNTEKGNILSGKYWGSLDNFNEDLKNKYNNNRNIVEVSQPINNCDFIPQDTEDLFKSKNMKCVWRRNDKENEINKIKLSISNVEKQLQDMKSNLERLESGN